MSFFEIFLYSLVAASAMLMGTFLVLCCEAWVRKNSLFLISFAAGVMLAIAFFNLIPEAQALHPNAWLMVFIGFLLLYVVQNVIMFHPCHEDSCESHHLGIFSSIGLTVHSFLDGVIVAIGFEANLSLGILTTLAVIFHKIPDGITITSILLHTRTERNKTILYSSLVALATPVGAIVAFLFLRTISLPVLGILLALTGGSFLYLAASDLIPETHKVRHWANALFFFIGVTLIIIIGTMLHHH